MTVFTRSNRGTFEVRRPRRPRAAAGSTRTAVRVIVAVAAMALVGAAWPLPVGTTLLLGVAVLLYALASMAGEPPDRG